MADIGPTAVEDERSGSRGEVGAEVEDERSGSRGEVGPGGADEARRQPTDGPRPAAREKEGIGAKLAAAFRRGSRRGATHEGRDELVRRARSGDDQADAQPDSADDERDDQDEDAPVNVIDAASRGASDGLSLALNVGAMLLAFISLIALANIILGGIGGLFGYGDLTVEQILGYVFSPVMAAVGVPWSEAVDAGSFLGQKVILNEFVAFSDFAPDAENYSDKAQAVITFALTGFANLGSLAILLGGLGGIAPTQRSVIARLGLRAVLAGTLGNLLSAAIAGVLIG